MRLRVSSPAAAIILVVGLASRVAAQPPNIGNCPVYPIDHIWNTPIDQLPVSPNSATWVSTIGPTKPLHPDFGAAMYDGEPIGIPFVAVPGTQTKYPATFTWPDESDPGPYAIPLDAPIEGGSNSTGDRHVIAVDVDQCVLYEMYNSWPQPASWSADAGAIFDLLSYPLRPATWTSADAAGLPILPGLVRYDEIASGEIRHAIRFTVPQTRRLFVWPARHYASSLTDPKYPPMGARFRLRADFNISGYSATNQIILLALKRYGMMLADNGSAWFISGAPDERWNDNDLHNLTQITGSNFEAVDVSPLMIDPNSGQAVQATQQPIQVTVSPSSATVRVGKSKQFTAIVENTPNTAVTWHVNGVLGGNTTVGKITTTGFYKAPMTVPSPSVVTVTAVSQADPTKSGSASVTVVPK